MDIVLDLPKLCGWSDREVPCEMPVPKRKITTFVIKKVLDSGAYGMVYSAHETDARTNIIVKIFKGSKEEIEHEICYQHLASREGVAPSILDYWFCGSDNDRALIAMDYGGNYNLEAYLKVISMVEIKDKHTLRQTLQVYPAMLNLYRETLILNNIGKIFHLDLHLRNAMVTVNKDLLMSGLKLIDFGKAENWEAYQRSINERIYSKDIPDSFDGIAFMYKAIYADIMMPTEFYYELFIKNSSPNLAMEWLFQDFINQLRSERYILNHKSWAFKNLEEINEHVNFIGENLIGDIDGHIEKKYSKLYVEIGGYDAVEEFLQEIIPAIE